MKIIKQYEEFTYKTISINNTEYNTFFDRYKDKDRSSVVAWLLPGSQEKNFKMVRKHINNGDSLLDYGCGIGDFIKNLEDNNIVISDYMGVDINQNFINIAKETYPENNFKLITSVNDIQGKWDTVCAIGVFTWFITKEEFIQTIEKLYDSCNKQVLITVLNGDTPYDYKDYDDYDEDDFWNEEYRYYSKKLFKTLFPNFKFKFEYKDNTMLICITK